MIEDFDLDYGRPNTVAVSERRHLFSICGIVECSSGSVNYSRASRTEGEIKSTR